MGGRMVHTLASPEVLQVATLNLAHGRGLVADQFGVSPEAFAKNIDAAAAVVKREKPDVLAVQEADSPSVWSGSFDHVQRLAKAAEYPHVYHGLHFEAGILRLRIQYGTALLARRLLSSPGSHRFAAPPLHTKGFVVADVEFTGRPLLVASIHLASDSTATRRRQVEELISVLGEVNKPVVLMGDLNSRWSNESDAVRVVAARLNLQAFEPEHVELATFRANAPRARIDWILISEELEFVEYRVWPDQVSDHHGVAAVVRWRK